MKIEETKLKGCFLIKPSLFEDKRGYFYESFNKKVLEKIIGYPLNFVQDNQSQSGYGVIRGLHLQTGNHGQAKLVRAIQGEILDVIVDVRKNSPTYGHAASFILSEENKQQLFVPKGFAHGFVVLSNIATIHYKADNYYNPQSESGVIYNDKDLAIDWKLSTSDIITSEKDLLLPTLTDFKNGQ
jgi:dTDP-4-dehydrorhamnose 3,5-epimerase